MLLLKIASPSNLRSRKRPLIATVFTAAALSATALALITRGRPSPAPGPDGTSLSASDGVPAQSGADGAGRGPVRVVRFALHDVGLLPREASVEHGRVVVSLTDYTGGAAGLVVERENAGGERERAGRVGRAGGRWRGRQEMSLGPGTYVVYDEGRPEVRATLTVEP